MKIIFEIKVYIILFLLSFSGCNLYKSAQIATDASTIIDIGKSLLDEVKSN